MPCVVDLFRLEKTKIMRWFELSAAGFYQHDAAHAPRETDRQGDPDGSSSHNRNFSLRCATVGQVFTDADHAIDESNSFRCCRVLTPIIAAVTKSGAIAADRD